MKRAYVRPTMVGERFVANEYVAACGDRCLGPYHACGVTHEAEVQDKFLKGYYVCGGSVTDVIIWRGEDGDNVHCTTNLKQETWGTAKS